MVVEAMKNNIAEIIGRYIPRPKAKTSRMTRRKTTIKSLDAAVAVCSKNKTEVAEIAGTIDYVANSVSSGLQTEPKAEKLKKTVVFTSYFRNNVSRSYRVLQKKARRTNYSVGNKMKQKEDMDVMKESKLKMHMFYMMQKPVYFIC